jgi:hypothetical protein
VEDSEWLRMFENEVLRKISEAKGGRGNRGLEKTA